MRWSIVRVIWLRELRDQLRDRRTVFMIAVLPILLYPLFGMGMMQLFVPYLARSSVIGVIGADNLPPAPRLPPAGLALPWLLTPAGPAQVVCAAAGEKAVARHVDFPPLLVIHSAAPALRIAECYFDSPQEERSYQIKLLPQRPGSSEDPLEALDQTALNDKTVDVILVVPPSFNQQLQEGQTPTLYVLTREKDDFSRLVQGRLENVLNRWKNSLKTVRMLRQGLPANYDEIFTLWDRETSRPAGERVSGELLKLLTQIFPFVLVLWSLAGALYPAVDLCAGEKERGTMETLLISPASREEIVWGKFLTIWVFSTATALLNLVSMGVTTWQFSKYLVHNPFQMSILFWGVLLLLPLSAFFSAVSLAVGVYARSSKEGQYYLMPLFLLTLPLIFLTLAPGVKLNPFYSMVPVTGVALLLQALMEAGTFNPSQYILYFIPVLAPMIIYSWLALRWAIEQFQREEVLFREAERLDLGLWLKRLFRDKEALPSTGQALFCFILILGLRWLSFNVGGQMSLLVRTGISQLAFVAAPALFMGLLLTTRPRAALGLALPPWWAWPVAVLLGVLVMPPAAGLIWFILEQFPGLKILIAEYSPLLAEFQNPQGDTGLIGLLQLLFVFGLLPAFCEELAFRGLILTGLARRFRPWTAIFLSSFLFSLYDMNVFRCLPHFVLGCILGFLVLRTGSVLTAMVFHFVYSALLLTIPALNESLTKAGTPPQEPRWFLVALIALCTVATLAILWGIALLRRKEGHSLS